MGLLHDIGKAAMPYQLYIRRPAGGPKGPDHSSAGAQEAALRLYPGLFGRMMAFGIAGHHAGLMDGTRHEGSTLSARLTKEVEDYSGGQDLDVGMTPAEELDAGMPAIPHSGHA